MFENTVAGAHSSDPIAISEQTARSMDGTIVFIFLLDQLPESILNKTLETIEVSHVDYSSPNTCDYTITNPLLQVISRELEVIMIPKWLFDENHGHGNTSNVKLKSHLDTNKVIESSLEDAANYKLDHHEAEHFHEKYNGRKPPLLAAIFESLSNITAQTCGGTVIAPNWVLTAASCINLLSNLNSETTNITEKSVYTVIVNATDPLTDGSAHNVTEVRLQPNSNDTTTAHIALLRLEPPIVIEEIVYEDVEEGNYVTVHGWATKKVDSDYDVMAPVSFKALALSPEDCFTNYNVTPSKRELCMATSDEYAEVASQMSWGGPVVSRRGGVVGVARGDAHAPLTGWTLAPHVKWIHATAVNA